MKGNLKTLFFAYSFPPVNRVGAVRDYNQAKHLARLGWEVSVVTPGPDVWKSVERAREVRDDLFTSGIRMIHTEHGWKELSADSLSTPSGRVAWAMGGVLRRAARTLGIEREAGWYAEAKRAVAGLVPDDVDVILASGPPFSSFRLVRDVGRRLDRPYVLSYRDLWSFNPHGSARRQGTIEAEREILEGASAVIAVSPGIANSLEANFGIGRKIQVVTNGFDPEDLRSIDPTPFDRFAIVYAGVFYPPKRVITPVLQALRLLKQQQSAPTAWEFHYFGAHGEHVNREARMADLEDRTVVHGPVSRRAALSAIRGAGVAVVITSVAPEGSTEERGIVTGKVFDAIGLGTPILAVAPRGSDLEGILGTAGLGRCFTGDDVEGIAQYLKQLMSGARPSRGSAETFAWPTLAAQVDAVLRRAVGADSKGRVACRA